MTEVDFLKMFRALEFRTRLNLGIPASTSDHVHKLLKLISKNLLIEDTFCGQTSKEDLPSPHILQYS